MTYINESLLTEMPLPAKWDAKVFAFKNTYTPANFKKVVQYALAHADEAVGEGSSRVAYGIKYLGRKTILKVAKKDAGVAQNEVEVELMFDNHYMEQLGLIIPGIDYDKKNTKPTWIHMERATKITNGQFVRAVGCDAPDLVGYVQDGTVDFHEPDLNKPTTKAFMDFAENWPELLNDYAGLDNWGWYKGRPVIVDAGFSRAVGKKYYSSYGTSDGKTQDW